MAETENMAKTIKDYLIRMAPDYSVFQLAEKYYYDNNLVQEYFPAGKPVFSYKAFSPGTTSYSSSFYRAMYQVYTDAETITIGTLKENEDFVVIEQKPGVKIVIYIGTEAPTLTTFPVDKKISLVIGVVF